MAAKRGPSPELVPSPFIKKRNLEWSIKLPAPATRASSEATSNSSCGDQQELADSRAEEGESPSAAAVEAGEGHVDDHLGYFSRILTKATLSPFPSGIPHLSVGRYQKLYTANFGSPRGAHFVVHQHDHPIAGTHYDLRLQINETSSASWAIKTASSATGSLLIWDSGTYTVLPQQDKQAPAVDPDSQPSSSDPEEGGPTEQEKLQRAFLARKIRIKLHGSRLPHAYVLSLRLTRDEDVAGRARSLRAPTTKQRRRTRRQPVTSSSDSEAAVGSRRDNNGDDDDDDAETVKVRAEVVAGNRDDGAGISAMEREIRELEDEHVRRTNAYAGAANTIGSVHQRRWYLSLDREACGFAKRRRRGGRTVWEPSSPEAVPRGGSGSEAGDDDNDGERGEEDGADRLRFPFYVRGVEVERSIVTGRLSADILRDEGVVGYVGRKGWRPVLN
ncbi:hypothetical protein DL764_001715 [Monosporascus ibericus]|uniref:DNA ligase D 3'-phosphoesterase domain-containing protein n=1 Tax=Monosporascus ibericus TaxID=155417 RepID=A0A4Q4TNC0_9PEZI|nr:hypothetical protein DL764_001715 [Monosporascus ibericus]